SPAIFPVASRCGGPTLCVVLSGGDASGAPKRGLYIDHRQKLVAECVLLCVLSVTHFAPKIARHDAATFDGSPHLEVAAARAERFRVPSRPYCPASYWLAVRNHSSLRQRNEPGREVLRKRERAVASKLKPI